MLRDRDLRYASKSGLPLPLQLAHLIDFAPLAVGGLPRGKKSIKNTKFEARNPKQIRMFKMLNSKLGGLGVFGFQCRIWWCLADRRRKIKNQNAKIKIVEALRGTYF